MFELLLITDPSAPRGLVGSVAAALDGQPPGRLAVQLRAKAPASARVRTTPTPPASEAPEPPARLLALARDLRSLTRNAGIPLLINGSLSLAEEVCADGVHLPELGPSPAEARARLGAGAIIGVSCHAPARLALAAEGGASFATLSPVYPSPGKGEPLGLARFAAWTGEAKLPVFALGGVTAAHALELRRAGASGLAVISAVFGAPEPAAAVRALLAAWDHLPAT